MEKKGLNIHSHLMIFVTLSFMLAFVPAIHICLASEPLTVITVFKKTDIDGEKIKLSDIAKIKGQNPVIVKQLGDIIIGNAPLPGKTRQLDKKGIKIRLRQNGFDLSHIDLKCCRKIEISRSCITISRKTIKKMVSDFIYKNTPWDQNRTTIKDIHVGHSVILPKGHVTYNILFPKNRELLGTIPLNVTFRVDRKFEKTVMVSARIEVFAKVVVAKRPVKRFHIITEDDICMKEMDLADLPSNVIQNMDDVLGKRAKRKINPQSPLRADLIDLPPVVKRGDVVSIIYESNGLKITALGIAKERGHLGERISVTNLDSGKRIYARILDSNTVKVDF